MFGPRTSSETYLYMTDYTINTDSSILPFESFTEEKGFYAESLAVNHPYEYSAGYPYAGFYVAKATDSRVYTRVVQKVSEVFSFIGGIVGAVSALLFVINKYTDFSLEVMIARVIFRGK